MGGKLSEGINFSDRLARALIVFGLPYSNIYGPEIIETMSYIDGKKTPNYTGKTYY
jgi:chromosome transmission fidelity protein 1